MAKLSKTVAELLDDGLKKMKKDLLDNLHLDIGAELKRQFLY